MIMGKKVQKQNIINQQYIINDNGEKGTETKYYKPAIYYK